MFYLYLVWIYFRLIFRIVLMFIWPELISPWWKAWTCTNRRAMW